MQGIANKGADSVFFGVAKAIQDEHYRKGGYTLCFDLVFAHYAIKTITMLEGVGISVGDREGNSPRVSQLWLI